MYSPPSPTSLTYLRNQVCFLLFASPPPHVESNGCPPGLLRSTPNEPVSSHPNLLMEAAENGHTGVAKTHTSRIGQCLTTSSSFKLPKASHPAVINHSVSRSPPKTGHPVSLIEAINHCFSRLSTLNPANFVIFSIARSSAVFYTCLLFAFLINGACGLGSMATIAASYDDNGVAFVCGIMQGPVQSIQCWNSSSNSVTSAYPSQLSYSGVSGGKGFFCGLLRDSGLPFCWNTNNISSPRRLKNQAFSDLVAGTSQVCALSENSTATNSTAAVATNGSFATCWRNETIIMDTPTQQAFSSLASGGDFVCGIKSSDRSVQCWGNSVVAQWPNATFHTIQAGASHACGLTDYFNVQCWGDNTYKQQDFPGDTQFLSLALGDRHSCGIEAFSRNVICWGDNSLNRTSPPADLTFYSIAAGDDFTCGILLNFSIICWGASFRDGSLSPLNLTSPSSCTNMACDSGSFQQSNTSINGSNICSSSDLHVCTLCRIGCQSASQTGQCTSQHDITCAQSPISSPSPSPSPTTTVVASNSGASPSQTTIIITQSKLSKGLIALVVLGALGVLCGLLTVGWCVWAKFCGPGFSFDGSQGRVHNSTTGGTGALTRPSSRVINRQRSSTSSVVRRGEITSGRSQAFTTADMAEATMGFSEENKIAAGSFGIVYRGILTDGREVAIKRREKETVANDKKMEEKESAFQSELEFLSRLHHKHLVSLVGYCDEEDERMLVYDYMPNGTLHDHLHGKGRLEGVLPWQMRIKIALEAARGVEYLHTYALPPIIHRDIKSSNILLDGGWNARVSDFGLSTRGPGENSHLSLMAAGTLGYMDPEYYRLQHLTTKSDVYSFGVVLLELLSGERAIHKQSHGPVNIVDFAVPRIVNNDLASVLDQRPGAPAANELKALEMIAQLAAKCVRLEGKERPTMTDVVAVLEEAMAHSSNGRSRSQSATVAALTLVPIVAASHTSATAFEPLEVSTDTISAPFEPLETAIDILTSAEPLEAVTDTSSAEPLEPLEAVTDTSSAEPPEPLEALTDTVGGAAAEPLAAVTDTVGPAAEPLEAMTDTISVGATEPIEVVTYTVGGAAAEPAELLEAKTDVILPVPDPL